MRSLITEARFGVRLLRREPGFALVAVLTIALGVGATTTLFSVAYGVLLKPLPWAAGDGLMRVTETRQGRTGRIRGTVSNGTYLAWAEQPETIEDIGGWLTQTRTLTGAGEPERLQCPAVTASLLAVLRARPLLGRSFERGEGARGQRGVALLSFGVWQSRFGGRTDVVGQSLELDSVPYTIVGVMPHDFAFPDREARLWTAWTVPPVRGEGNSISGTIFRAIVRLRHGATAAQAAAEATARGRSAEDMGMTALALFGSRGPVDIAVGSLADSLTAEVKPAIVVLLVAVGLLLVTATANVASLQLARATARRHEFAIRAAIGAGAGRLTRQLLVETSLIGLCGGAAGVGFAAAMNRALPSILPADFPRLDAIGIDWRMMLFALVVSLGVSAACALLPALHARRANLVAVLAESGTTPSGGGLRSRTAGARTLIMAGQIAVACVLLVGAALLGRSFVALLHADRGYDPENLLTARVIVPPAYSPERRLQLIDALLARLRALPGVMHAAGGNSLPFVTMGGFSAWTMPSLRNIGAQVDVQAIQRIVTPEYFSAMRLRVVEGRALSSVDTESGQPVVVVNRSFARAYLPDHPVGTRLSRPKSASAGFRFRQQTDAEVVGVVDDVRQESVEAPAQPELFIALPQAAPASLSAFDPIVVLKTASDPLALVAALRNAVRLEGPTLAIDSVMTMEDRVVTSLARPRTYALLLGGFAAFAALIAGVGLFGVLSYSVAQRSREIGVRTALGARPRDIIALVLRQAMVMAGIGVAVGMVVASASAKVLAAFLFGITAHDAWSFAAVPVVLVIVTAIACVVPARRAARVDPLIVLKST
jgi:putative ABC transport system permease protein